MLAAAAALRLALSLPGSVWLAVPLLRISSLFPQNSQHFPSLWLPQNAHPQQFPEEKALAAALFLLLRAVFLSFLNHQEGKSGENDNSEEAQGEENAPPASFRGLFVPFARLLRPAWLWVAFSQFFLAFSSSGGENAVLAVFKQLCTFAAPLLLVVCGVNAAVVFLWSARRFCERFVAGGEDDGEYEFSDGDDGEGASGCGVGRSGVAKAAVVVIALLAAFGALFELYVALHVEGLPATMGAVVGVLGVAMVLLCGISLWSEGGVLTDAPLVSLLAAHAVRRASVLLGSEVATSSASTAAAAAAAAGKKVAARAARASAASVVDWLLPLPVARKPAAASSSGVSDDGVFADVVGVVRDLVTFDDVVMLLLLLFAFWGGRWAAQAKTHFALYFPGDEDDADASDLYEDEDLGDRIRRVLLRLWHVVQPSTFPAAMLILLYTHFVMVLFGDVPGIAPGWFILEACAALGTGFVALLREAYSDDDDDTHYHAD
jgi:hypothetical protein